MVFACVSFNAVAAGNARDVYWAGFAFTGDQAAIIGSVPHSNSVIQTHGIELLNQKLSGELAKHPPANITLISDGLAKLDGSTSAVVMASALDRELVSVEPLGGKYKVLVEVALQALFFDFRERQVIASYPMTLQRIDLKEAPPTDSEIDQIINDLLYGTASTSLSAVLAKTVADARLPGASVRRLQVRSISLSDAVRSKLPDKSQEPLLKEIWAHELSKALSSNTGVGLLPPGTGVAIGNTMAARFADGKVYQLKIPDPDYAVDLKLDALKNGVIAQTPAMRTMLFGVFFEASVVEPFSGKVFFDQTLRKGATKIVPATQSYVDAWSASYETVLAGFDAFGQAAAGSKDAGAWLKQQKPGGRQLKQQMKVLQELIASCR